MASASQSFALNSSLNPDFQGTSGIQVNGVGTGRIRVDVNWNDDPDQNGDALGTINISGYGSIGTGGENGSGGLGMEVSAGQFIGINWNNLNSPISAGNNRITFRDNDGNDINGEATLSVVRNDTFVLTLSNSINANPTDAVGTNVVNVFWSSNMTGAPAGTTFGSSVTGVVNSSATSGSVSVNTGLQSNVESGQSPRTTSANIFTFANAPGFGFYSISSLVGISVRNDGDPQGLSIPSTTATPFASLSSLESNTTYSIDCGTISGIDMPINYSSSSGLQFSTNNSSWQSSGQLTNGQRLYVRFQSLPFNTNPAGITNSQTLSFTVGPDTYSFTATTRAPIVAEVFNFEGPQNYFPNPDIDTDPSSPPAFMETGIDVLVDDVEIPVEIKTSDGNAQVRINGGSWQYMRQI